MKNNNYNIYVIKYKKTKNHAWNKNIKLINNNNK